MSLRRLAGLSIALALLAVTPAHACSIIFPGYKRLTAEADALAIVKVVSVGPSKAMKSDNPFVPTSYGEATAVVQRQLTGARLPREVSVTYWDFEDEVSCGAPFKVAAGKSYYIWFKRDREGLLHTYDGTALTDMDRRARNELETMILQPRTEWPRVRK